MLPSPGGEFGWLDVHPQTRDKQGYDANRQKCAGSGGIEPCNSPEYYTNEIGVI